MGAASAFNVKGLVYRGTREFYDKRLPGGIDALRKQLVDPELVRFWEQSFSPGAWYDLYPLMSINQAAARIVGVPYTTLVTENASYIAERDINGVYRLLLKLASPELVASKLPRASLQYLDFGEAEGRLVAEKKFWAVQKRVPASFAAWMTASVQGFAPKALAIAGAHDIDIQTRSVSEPGATDEARTVELTHEVTWR